MHQSTSYYTNPVLQGFYPDPAICRAGEDYYLVCSSFAYFPGLPVFHCRDLVSWRPAGHAIDREEQMSFDGLDISEGLWAPAITFHEGVFYITCTLMPEGRNFIISAVDPRGPWSIPMTLDGVEGIDPSLFFDRDGQAWIVYNSIAPGNRPQWEGHRTIRMRSFDVATGATGPERILIDGGVDPSQHPVWIEGPHLYEINGWYYLLCAEGGTGFHHSAVVFRSRNVEGPYTPAPNNPILTQRTLEYGRQYPVTTAGHADLVQTPAGDWHAVFLACRPYKKNYFNTGRETFLAPVGWEHGWPCIIPPGEAVRYCYPLPFPRKAPASQTLSGNFAWSDDFTKPVMDHRYIFLRGRPESIYIHEGLHLGLSTATIMEKGRPSFAGFRQQHLRCTATACLSFDAQGDGGAAGLVIFQDRSHFYFLCKTMRDNTAFIAVMHCNGNGLVSLGKMQAPPQRTWLRIEAREALYFFHFSADGKNWEGWNKGFDATCLSTETAGGFTGCVFGLYACAAVPTANRAKIHSLAYEGHDAVFSLPRNQIKKWFGD